MGGGEDKSSSPHSLPTDCVYLAGSIPQSTLRSRSMRKDNEEEKSEHDYGSGSEIASITLDSIEQTRIANTYKHVLDSYRKLPYRSMNFGYLEDAKRQILRHTPGAWAENKIGYAVPKTTTLLLVGSKGAGKSSLVNRISEVFEHDKFVVDRAQVSYNSSGDGTCFLQEYRIPRHSKSFSLFDTRSLSDDPSENMKILEKWMTEGVQHGDPVIRDSDSASLKRKLEDREISQSDNVSKKMVSYVIFVVNGISVLKSMAGDDEATRQCTDVLLPTFNYPFLSIGDDKPVVVVTHGDLLSLSDRARVRIHLGELLGMHPTKQIFDIPTENCDPAPDVDIVEMLRYALEHADRNLSRKQELNGKKTLMDKVLNVLPRVVSVLLVIVMGIYMMMIAARLYCTSSCSATHVHDTHSCSPRWDHHQPPPPDTEIDHRLLPPGTRMDHQPSPLVQLKEESSVKPKEQPAPTVKPTKRKKQPPPPPSEDSKEDWHSIRHMWLGSEYD